MIEALLEIARLLVFTFIIIFLSIFVYSIVKKLRTPFVFPSFKIEFDVSGKRNPQIEDHIDTFLINNGLNKVFLYERQLKEWYKKCEQLIANSRMPDYRRKQYNRCLLEKDSAYKFLLVRNQKRYRQTNYKKESYDVKQTIFTFSCDLNYLKDRDAKLKAIGYECTLSTYYAKEQRRNMTTALRQQIKERDNYTCQICGKYMPDEVGLHIDHIIPIAKGGKSLPSNLQVLCSKCNGSKHDKIL